MKKMATGKEKAVISFRTIICLAACYFQVLGVCQVSGSNNENLRDNLITPTRYYHTFGIGENL